ncbi:small ribosomal subunit protein bS18 [Blastococcus saxobsidens]|uniref:Small ribosomal subunit protein bS18 n=1 Tax=Blastococcus saxobsidens TaxID=138336 RepID=A0A4Q7YBK2_9ACTN|nr:SSU ribosomal protein S18P [Blastococcus saxobsidens]
MSAPRPPRPRRKRRLDGPFSYHDLATLRSFVSDRGKIRSRRVTGLDPKQHRQVARAIKNAREMALLPYPTAGR